jgi:hypothetical protein
MRYTLLELTQQILSSMDSDEVNSISDTTEATQVAYVIKETYNEIISRANLPEHFTLFELDAASLTNPTVMSVPEDIYEINWIKYDCSELDDPALYKTIQYKALDQFFAEMHMIDTTLDDVTTGLLTLGSATINLIWYDNKAPSYWTTYDDNTVIFDSYDIVADTFLQNNKSLCYGQREPTFTFSDSFEPDLDTKQFALLLAEAKAQAFLEIKQTENPKAEQRARKGWIGLQRYKQKLPFPKDNYSTLPNYSRK